MTDAAIEPTARPRNSRRSVPASLYVGCAILFLIALAALVGPYLMAHGYDQLNVQQRFSPPNLQFWAGTDEFGRDVLTRTIHGARLSLFVGATATALALAVGVPIGLFAAYAGGLADEVAMRILDLVMAFPPVLLMLLIISVTTPGLWKTVLVVAFLFVPGIARVTRSAGLAILGEEYVLAAKARGEGAYYIVFREILPNALPAIIVEGSIRFTFAILFAAVLSFLGFGVQPPSADWGMMINEARPYLSQAPWIALTPGIAMSLTVMAVNLVGDGLRERFDPRPR